MIENFERAKSRLSNIQAIEPLLSALRTLSMGAWQMAIKKIAQLEQFEAYYNRILAEILPELEFSSTRKKDEHFQKILVSDTIYFLIGTERGLCGKFNQVLVEKSLALIEEQNVSSYQIWAMGSRLIRELERRGIDITLRNPLPASSHTSYKQTYLTTQNWLEQYETFAFNRIELFYHEIVKGGQYQFLNFQLLPFKTDHIKQSISDGEKMWPPPIIETNPRDIYHQIIQHFIASNFHKIILKSAASEHSARYKLMQEAEENADEIMEELRRLINAERRRKITQDMQELASGSGLLNSR